jgi:hypothetical protein
MNAESERFRSNLRNWSNEQLARIWRAHKTGELLNEDEKRLAARMAGHPEWETWWERADDLGDAQPVTPGGVNPFACVFVEAAAEGMIAEHKQAASAYTAMTGCGLSHDDARSEIGRALLGVMWEAEHRGVDPTQRLVDVLRQMEHGASASAIFS